jgi:hypothetical protein
VRKYFLCVPLVCMLVFSVRLFAESPEAGVQSSAGNSSTSLHVALRLPDNVVFEGEASLRILAENGTEIAKVSSGEGGEATFENLPAGRYLIEVNAPGYQILRQPIDWAAGHDRSLFLLLTVQSTGPETEPPAEDQVRAREPQSWIPPDVDSVVPPLESGVSCNLQEVLRGVGARLKQFVSNLQKFSATEEVNHYKIDSSGERRGPESKKFDYMVEVQTTKSGAFYINEFRDGSVDPTIFPAGIATEGVPAMALIFHPAFAHDYAFNCEGLGKWNGRPAWQVHFTQKPDHPGGIREYQVRGMIYPISLRGRAWFDPGTLQILHLETDLSAPVEEIKLTREHIAITYGRVNFRTNRQEMWLPQRAEIYAEQYAHRYYRLHTFSNFHVFTVETAQSYQPPKQSYCFTNTIDRSVSAILTVVPLSRVSMRTISVKFSVPAGGSECKSVGVGKDLNLPPEAVESATLFHDGPPGALRPDAYLLKESTLDIVPNSDLKAVP